MQAPVSFTLARALIPSACVGLLWACAAVDGDPAATSTHRGLEARALETGMRGYSEGLPIEGLFPVPEVGATYYLEDTDASPIGMSRGHSFRYVGVSDSGGGDQATREDVLAARDLLLELQRLTTRAVRLTLSKSWSTDGDATGPRIEEQLAAVDDRISRVRADIQHLTRKEGLIIARWTGDPVGLDDPEAATGGNRRSGFVVLAQPRVALLFVGDDFKQLVGMRPVSEGLTFKESGFTTYVLQAKHVSYVSDTDVEDDLGLSVRRLHEMLSEAAATIGDPARLATAEYLADLAQFSNLGNVGAMRWVKEPHCFVAGSDLMLHSRGGEAWTTVISQIAHGDAFPRSTLSAFRYEFRKGRIPPKDSGRLPCSPSRCSQYPQIGSGVATHEGPLPAADSEDDDG